MIDYNKRLLQNVVEDYVDEWTVELRREREEAKKATAFQNKDGEADAFAEKYGNVKKKKPGFLFLKVASVLLVVALCTTVIPISVEGRKSTVAEFVINYVNSEFIAVGSSENDGLFLSFEGEFFPSYVPEGYYVECVNNNKAIKEIIFTNNDGNLLLFSENSLDVNFNLDYENVKNKIDFEVMGYNAFALEKEGGNCAVILTEDKFLYAYCDDANVDITGFAKLIERR